jgi:hypothetical protein
MELGEEEAAAPAKALADAALGYVDSKSDRTGDSKGDGNGENEPLVPQNLSMVAWAAARLAPSLQAASKYVPLLSLATNPPCQPARLPLYLQAASKFLCFDRTFSLDDGKRSGPPGGMPLATRLQELQVEHRSEGQWHPRLQIPV